MNCVAWNRSILAASLVLLICSLGCGSGSSSGMPETQISATQNPLVAQYQVTSFQNGSVWVEFGTDTTYGKQTSAVVESGDQFNNTATVLVAGMKASTTYHMRAHLDYVYGGSWVDQDHTFQTGSVDPPAGSPAPPTITATTTPGMTPQSGVELLDPVSANPMVTDLSGNILWTYTNVPSAELVDPIKLLPNGDFLMNFSQVTVDGQNSILQEVDLTGALIWQMSAADLNSALATAGCVGCNITVVGTHHDFVMLPNGHLILIAATQKNISGTTVTGDVLIDLDQNRTPVWLWNEFDHLDVNRRPFGFPDWTHSNAVIYSPDDGNLIVSSRHQSWLIKVDYSNGAGSGDILWKLGYQGDFKLVGGIDPDDWFYAQHGPSFVSSNTTGNFSLTVFDNGDDRTLPAGVPCVAPNGQPCPYSTVAVLQIDENAKTATITVNPMAPAYSFFGGNAEVLQNGDLEFCESADGSSVAGDIYEVTQDSSAQTVWQMQVAGRYVYRGQRIPSLYPGVQW
jgi:hypothetical protein